MKRDLFIRLCLILGIALCAITGSAQSLDRSVQIFFHRQSSVYDPNYNGNSQRLKTFTDSLVTLLHEGNYEIVRAEFHAGTSPEGPESLNRRLSHERFQSGMAAFLEVIGDDIVFRGDSLRTISTTVGKWDEVIPILESMQGCNRQDSLFRRAALGVLRNGKLSDVEKIEALRTMDGGAVWNYLDSSVLPELRISSLTLKLSAVEPLPELESTASSDSTDASSPYICPVQSERPDTAQAQLPQEVWNRKLRIGTNALGLGLLIGNISGEIDITKNISFYLPVYYSALDYFKPTVKFRTFAIQPELRWNFNRPEGLFAGAHFGLAYFNLATDGNWRIQTLNGNEPMLGGGLSLGYRLPLDNNKKWNVEFVLGAGAYRFHYDRFYNEPNGALDGSVKTVYWGLDNAVMSISYSFDLRRGGRK